MSDSMIFAGDVLVAAIAGLGVLLAFRLADWLRIPASVLVLAAAAVTVSAVPDVHHPSQVVVQRVVTVALIAVLFAGGMGMGRRRFQVAGGPILVLGVAGTFATAALAGAFIHFAFGLSWYVALLVGTAVAPTDPAVVFSVLGQRRVAGRSGTILEGESGANDPVGISLMAGLIGAGSLSGAGVGHAVSTFFLQMGVGAAIGGATGAGLLWMIRKIRLPGQGLDPIRTLVVAFLVYGVAAVAHGSGFLAVFIAGIIVGGQEVPHRMEIQIVHAALGSLGEMAAFVALGLTIHLHVLSRADVWGPGLALGVVLAVAIRPLVARVCLTRTSLTGAEKWFVQLAGLKGAVPILLGGYLLQTKLPDTSRLYGIVIVVVAFSVLVQGSLVGPMINRLRLPLEQ